MKQFGRTLLQFGLNGKNLPHRAFRAPLMNIRVQFCSKKATPETPGCSPQISTQIKQEQVMLGQQKVISFQTLGAFSILDQIQGAKQTENGGLYALKFRCGICNTQAIRSFTKNAYHNGVVLITCQGCENVHLVADNLGWFRDDPSNLDDLSQQKVQKVADPAAVVQFLKAALGKQKKLQEKSK